LSTNNLAISWIFRDFTVLVHFSHTDGAKNREVFLKPQAIAFTVGAFTDGFGFRHIRYLPFTHLLFSFTKNMT
jgi:hypothetical protein